MPSGTPEDQPNLPLLVALLPIPELFDLLAEHPAVLQGSEAHEIAIRRMARSGQFEVARHIARNPDPQAVGLYYATAKEAENARDEQIICGLFAAYEESGDPVALSNAEQLLSSRGGPENICMGPPSATALLLRRYRALRSQQHADTQYALRDVLQSASGLDRGWRELRLRSLLLTHTYFGDLQLARQLVHLQLADTSLKASYANIIPPVVDAYQQAGHQERVERFTQRQKQSQQSPGWLLHVLHALKEPVKDTTEIMTTYNAELAYYTPRGPLRLQPSAQA